MLPWIVDDGHLNSRLLLDLICTGVSVVILITTYDAANKRGVQFALGCYLIYNFATCIIWCAEVGLPVLAHGRNALSEFLPKLELGASIYFLVDAAVTFAKWKLNKDYEDDMDFTVAANCLLYAYLSLRVAQRYMSLTIRGIMELLYGQRTHTMPPR